MHGNPSLLALIAGSLLFASALFALLAAPGLLTDDASTVPVSAAAREAGR